MVNVIRFLACVSGLIGMLVVLGRTYDILSHSYIAESDIARCAGDVGYDNCGLTRAQEVSDVWIMATVVGVSAVILGLSYIPWKRLFKRPA